MNNAIPGSSEPEESLRVWPTLAEEHFYLAGEPKPSRPYEQDEVVRLLHGAKRSALCLSGGGVRSSTFSLGILQGLANYSWKEPLNPGDKDEDPQLLAQFDYLSTVSGGGYTGAWFSSWAAHESTNHAIREMVKRSRDKNCPEPLQIQHLRSYASFLNPKIGLMSPDTWTLVTTILRNIVLNWLILIPLLAAAMMLPRIFDTLLLIYDVPLLVNRVVLALAFLTGACSCFYMVSDLPSAGNNNWSQKSFLIFCLGALSLSGILTAFYWYWNPPIATWNVIGFTVAMVLSGPLVASLSTMKLGAQDIGKSVKSVVGGTLAGLLGGYLAHRVGTFMHSHTIFWQHHYYAWLAFPAIIFIYGIFQIALVALTSKITDDEDREWWARAAAWFAMLLAFWVAAMGLVLFASELREYGINALYQFTGATTISGAILSLLGFSPKTKSAGKVEQGGPKPPSIPARVREYLVRLMLPVFFILLLMTIAIAERALSENVVARLQLQDWHPFWVETSLAVAMALAGLLAAFTVNANKFSLNGMYRLRLIRTFLGASNLKREPNPLTGFDSGDNVKMSALPKKPFHIVNMALNLVAGKKLAWQQRKAESFTASPLHCGSMHVGYVPSSGYAKAAKDPSPTGFSGMSLGTAITISGAAASPNMGYHSSPLVTIAMTLFNARLGAWLPNPGAPGKGYWGKNAPEFAARPMIDEAFGQTTDSNRWVYLSDGGHFENLGLYEMVLRRCHSIVVVDGSADPHYTCEDLANAIRKVRVDLGIEIEFKGEFPIHKHGEGDGTAKHCAHGVIRYSCIDEGAQDGDLIYIKTSLNGNEPRDVLNYSVMNTAFPQQPTYDLWFDEAQLESYRRLGQHVIEEICGPNPHTRPACSVHDFMEYAKGTKTWAPSKLALPYV